MVINGIEIQVPTYQMFRKELRLQGRNYHWLANVSGYSYIYISYLLTGLRPLNETNIRILSECLEMPLTPVKPPPVQ